MGKTMKRFRMIELLAGSDIVGSEKNYREMADSDLEAAYAYRFDRSVKIEKTRYLCFTHRGENFVVNERNEMTQEKRFNENQSDFSGGWRLLGVSKHHMSNGVDLAFRDLWIEPKRMIGGLVWDIDHGTIRKWGGAYSGKLPRVTDAWTMEKASLRE